MIGLERDPHGDPSARSSAPTTRSSPRPLTACSRSTNPGTTRWHPPAPPPAREPVTRADPRLPDEAPANLEGGRGNGLADRQQRPARRAPWSGMWLFARNSSSGSNCHSATKAERFTASVTVQVNAPGSSPAGGVRAAAHRAASLDGSSPPLRVPRPPARVIPVRATRE